MSAQRIYIIVGGTLDGHAFRPECGRIDGTWLELEDELYRVARVPETRDRLMVPRRALVHPSIPERDVLWRVFMGTMRAWAAEVLR